MMTSDRMPIKTVLLVDDSADNLRVTGELLRGHYRVQIATCGDRALAIARMHPPPDLILLDIMMPEMDGFEVLHRLRSIQETAAIPVIFVTALADQADEARGLALGAVDYISKPIVPGLLLARVRTQLELKDARDWLKDRAAVLAREVTHQVAELKAAKEAAEAASRSKSDFIEIMSDEFKTPMNGVIGMLQLILDEAGTDSPVHDYALAALGSAQTMVNLIKQVLEYAAITHDGSPPSRKPIATERLIEDLATAWADRIRKKGLAFRVSTTPDLPGHFHGDERGLHRIMGILLDNAVKYTAEGFVEIGAETSRNELRLWVRDTGVGMSGEAKRMLFQPFTQQGATNIREHGGIGLELAIAHRKTVLMGGTLEAESSPGEGTTFSLRLPVATAGDSGTAAPAYSVG
jgi:signal transduction histidine kinase